MILFPEWFFVGLVIGGVALAALGAITLLGLLIRDWSGRSVW